MAAVSHAHAADLVASILLQKMRDSGAVVVLSMSIQSMRGIGSELLIMLYILLLFIPAVPASGNMDTSR